MRIISSIFWVIIIALVVIFTIINSQSIQINFYFTTIQFYLPLLLLINLIIGSLLGVLAMLPLLLRAKSKSRAYKHRAEQAEEEVNNLRSIPIKDQH